MPSKDLLSLHSYSLGGVSEESMQALSRNLDMDMVHVV